MPAQTFETRNYNSTLSTLNTILNAANRVVLTDELKTYLTGKTLATVKMSDTLVALKISKALTLPGYVEYLNSGIDLAATVPDNPASVKAVNELVECYKVFGKAEYITYSNNGWVINEAGNTYLNNFKVTLTAKQMTLFNAIKALHTMLTDNGVSGSDFKRVLSEELVGFMGQHYLESELVDNIKKITK